MTAQVRRVTCGDLIGIWSVYRRIGGHVPSTLMADNTDLVIHTA
jgi:hypothetical protein